jgi:ABC-type Zn uptake system ZnuABC Zn-binding protein ZnuA
MRGTFAGALTIVLTAVAALSFDQSRAADKLKVVATFTVIGDMVANVAGDHVELITIVGPDGDTELYQPTLADSRSVARARVLFMNDLNDEFERSRRWSSKPDSAVPRSWSLGARRRSPPRTSIPSADAADVAEPTRLTHM